MLQKGLTQVYTSESDHMNYAPIGLSLRAAGQGLRTLIVNFVPYELMEGANTASLLLQPNLYIDHSAFDQSVLPKREKSIIPEKVSKTFTLAREALFSGDFEIVILSGIFQMVNQNLLSTEAILGMMKEKPKNVELVLTGQKADDLVVEEADLVTEMIVFCSEETLEKDDTVYSLPTEVVTGNGKGKTTYCMGKAMLTSCLGFRTTVFQFIKSPKNYGEEKAVKKFPNMAIRAMGEGFLSKSTATSRYRHQEAAIQAWEECLKDIFSLNYGLIVLDEINIATYYGLANAERLRDMLFLKPQNLHLILSGRKAHLEVRERAKTVITMREIKHPYKKGIKARKGIEF